MFSGSDLVRYYSPNILAKIRSMSKSRIIFKPTYPYEYAYVRKTNDKLERAYVVYRSEFFFLVEFNGVVVQLAMFKCMDGGLTSFPLGRYEKFKMRFFEASNKRNRDYLEQSVLEWASFLDNNFMKSLPIDTLIKIKDIIDGI